MWWRSAVVRLILVTGALGSSAAAAQGEDSWTFGAGIYGWLPSISADSTFPSDGGEGGLQVDASDILDNLEFVFMGSADIRKGRLGVATDLIYISLGKSRDGFRDGSIGGGQIPVDASATIDYDLSGLVWTAAGYYRAADSEHATFDVLAGVRYADIEQTLAWSFSGNVGDIPIGEREGGGRADVANWDFVLGLRGHLGLGSADAWFLPYYLDVGTGDSDVTVQAMAGIGYTFGWGDLIAAYRVLSYDLKSGGAVAGMSFDGPLIGAMFRW
jgi:hypothetical protein